MFILDFFLGGLMDQFIDWVYSQLVGFFGNFFAEMGNMGVELFEMSWVQSIVLFFSYLAWTLYVVGLVVAVFEVGIEYQTGRASPQGRGYQRRQGLYGRGVLYPGAGQTCQTLRHAAGQPDLWNYRVWREP